MMKLLLRWLRASLVLLLGILLSASITAGCSAEDTPGPTEQAVSEITAAADSTNAATPGNAIAATPNTATPGDGGASAGAPIPDIVGSAGLTRPWTGDLDGMEERRLLRILTVYGAGRYYLDGADEKGLTYELGKSLESYLNEQLERAHLKVHVVFVPVARDQLIPALVAGRGDIIAAGLTITPEREELIAFTRPISRSVSEVLVTGPSAPEIKKLEDLAGQTVHLRKSSSYYQSVMSLNERFTDRGLAAIEVELVSESLEDDDLIEMVHTGLLPWAIVDSYKTQLWTDVFTEMTVRDDLVLRTGGKLAWGFRKQSPLLEAQLNKFLATHKQGTLLGNMLINRYIRDFDWASNALDKADYARFEQLVAVFETYGEEYGLDYLMMAAQGYQESRLDQAARSSAGAIGIMQLLPSTARDPNVDIPNIHEVDANIHAGVKYLDFLRDRYFDSPDIDPFNRTLLAFGAYNAGPARMIRLRSRAEAEGYDPNVWFDNVEVIAAKEIGRETVQYVANIYKYYLAYRLIAQQEARRSVAREAAGIN